MSEPAGAQCRTDYGRCVTCGDEGTELRVLELAGGTARCVDEQGVIHAVALDLIGNVQPGDRLLAHAGVALTQLEAAG